MLIFFIPNRPTLGYFYLQLQTENNGMVTLADGTVISLADYKKLLGQQQQTVGNLERYLFHIGSVKIKTKCFLQQQPKQTLSNSK